MPMKNPVVVIKIADLIDFLKTKTKEALASKYFELHCAVVMAKFVSKQRSEEHRIGFPAIERKRREFGKVEDSDDFGAVLEEFVNKDSAQDIFLIPESEIERGNEGVPKGNAFQLKRVFTDDTKTSLEEYLIHYLNNVIPKKYAKTTHTELVLILSTQFSKQVSVNLRKVREQFTAANFPFERILVVAAGKDTVTIAEIWPDFGQISYTHDEFDHI